MALTAIIHRRLLELHPGFPDGVDIVMAILALEIQF